MISRCPTPPSLHLPWCVARGGRLATYRSPWLLTTGTTSLFKDFRTCLMPDEIRGIYVLLPARARRLYACRVDIVSLGLLYLYLNHLWGNLLVTFAHIEPGEYFYSFLPLPVSFT